MGALTFVVVFPPATIITSLYCDVSFSISSIISPTDTPENGSISNTEVSSDPILFIMELPINNVFLSNFLLCDHVRRLRFSSIVHLTSIKEIVLILPRLSDSVQ